MDRGLANAAARPVATTRSRLEPVARRRAPEAAPPRAAAHEAAAPTMRERMQASFAPAVEALPLPVPAEPEAAARMAAPAPQVAAAVTTRDRIVSRATAPPEPAAVERRAPEPPAPAVVVDLAEFRERRKQREPESEETRPVARGPPSAEAEHERQTDEAEPVRPDVEAAGAPARAGPEASAVPALPAPAAEAVAAPAAEPEAAAEGEKPKPGAAAAEAAAPEAPAAPPKVIRNPEDEPGFQAMKERAVGAGARAKRHQTGRVASDLAQSASQPDPAQDVAGQAAESQVYEMERQEPGPFDPAAFKADVKKAVEGMAPPATLEEADEFEGSGKAAGATSFIQQLVLQGRAQSEQAIKVATETPPSTEGKEPKVVGEMLNDRTGAPVTDVGAQGALPGPRPPEEIDLSAGPREINAKMAEAGVSEQQLADANESDFSGALDSRTEVREHAAAAPVDYRLQEEAVLAQGRADAEVIATSQLEGIHVARAGTLQRVLGKKDDTKTADEQLREEVHAALIDIHDRTQKDVTELLATLDSTVDTLFTEGEKNARETFERDVADKMRAYKADRYGGLGGGVLWAKDKLFDLPDEVNDFYRDGRIDYLAAMDRVIDLIAIVVGLLLGAAKLRIQAGREEVRTYVDGLPTSVKALGDETAADLDNRFDQLDSDVDAKRDELVDSVARKYVESRDGLDERIEELKEANKGLVSKAIDAIVRVIKTIYELSKLLLRVLLKAAAAIGDIIAHPIRFLENLVGAVKGGLDRFVSRIWTHLQDALLELLFGELGSTGITMPKQLDFAGVLDLVLQVLGLTYQSIRDRVSKRFGEDVVLKMEEGVDVFKTLVKDGVAGLWTLIREQLSDLEDFVVGKIKTYIVERVVAAGISYIVALLNPAAAFIKACQGIYQIVMFIVERAKQIAEFVDAVLDSIMAIAQGNVGAAIEKIEAALAGGLSLAIGFLARLANLGGLSEKVRSIIALVRRPITRVIDKIVFGAAQLYRRTLGSTVALVRGKVEAGREWAREKAEAGKAWAARKVESAKVRITGADIADAKADDVEPKEQPAAEVQPMRLAEETVEVGRGERHTVFAELAASGQVAVGINSSPQLLLGLARHYESRISSLPERAPNPPPEGGAAGDQPRFRATQAASKIIEQVGPLEDQAERAYAVGPMTRAQLAERAKPRGPPPGVKVNLAKLARNAESLLRVFYVYDKPTFERVEDEPSRGQKMTARIFVRPIVTPRGEEVLPERGTRGLDPARTGAPGYAVIAPAAGLAAEERGGVREGAEHRARGVVQRYAVAWGSGEREVIVRTWAIGGTPKTGAHESHTEMQLHQWFKAQGPEFHRRVTAIELRSVNSPCAKGCVGLLEQIAGMVQDRPRGTPSASIVLFWDQVYAADAGGDEERAAWRTRGSHVASLRGANWIVHGPMPFD